MDTSFKKGMKPRPSLASHCRALVSLGLPIVVGNIGNVVLSFADTLMVGHYGMRELAAASFVNTLIMLLIVFAMGFAMSLTPEVGRRFGRGELGRIGGVVRAAAVANTLLAAMLMGVSALLYTFVGRMGQPEELLPLIRPYLLVNLLSLPFVCWTNMFRQLFDTLGHTKVSMVVMVVSNLANIAGNYALIYGHWGLPEAGLLGAGVSTALSRVLMVAMFMAVFFGFRRYRVFRRGFAAGPTDWAVFRRLSALGWPSALQTGMETAAFSLTAVFVGWIGTTALAAHQVMITVSGLFYMVYLGIAVAVSVRVSHFSGQGDLQAISDTTRAGFRLILAMAATVSVPIFFLRHQIGGWFTDDATVGVLVAQTVIPLILYQFGDGLQCTFANALRGLGRMRPLMYASFVAYFVVSLPLSWLLGICLGYGLVGVWSAFPVCLMVAGALYVAIFRRSMARLGAAGRAGAVTPLPPSA